MTKKQFAIRLERFMKRNALPMDFQKWSPQNWQKFFEEGCKNDRRTIQADQKRG